jgi:hypothetical protein
MAIEEELTPSPSDRSHDDRRQRWQKISLDHMGYTINPLLTLTVAAIGYWFTLLKDDTFKLGSTAKCAFLLSFIGLAIAGISAIVCIVARVYDFRWTARRAADHPQAPSQESVRTLDSLVRGSFVAQLVCFVLGVAALATALLLTYGAKLA